MKGVQEISEKHTQLNNLNNEIKQNTNEIKTLK